VPRTAASDAKTFFTSDWEIPNCRAISDGLMPALNAARTALICPRVNETLATSNSLGWEDLSARDERFVFSSLTGNLPRPLASWRHAAISRSNSLSVRCLTALGRS